MQGAQWAAGMCRVSCADLSPKAGSPRQEPELPVAREAPLSPLRHPLYLKEISMAVSLKWGLQKPKWVN